MAWYFVVGIALGLYMIWGGATKATSKPYFLLHARASLLWKDKAHSFLLFSGVLVSFVMVFVGLSQ